MVLIYVLMGLVFVSKHKKKWFGKKNKLNVQNMFKSSMP